MTAIYTVVDGKGKFLKATTRRYADNWLSSASVYAEGAPIYVTTRLTSAKRKAKRFGGRIGLIGDVPRAFCLIPEDK